MLTWIKSKELFLASFILLSLKNVIVPATVGDALVFISVTALYGLNLYINSKKETPINEEVKAELKELKSAVSALSIRPITQKPPSSGRMF